MADLQPAAHAASRYSARTIDHLQRPRNVGHLPEADAVGEVDDPSTETTVRIYLKLDDQGRVARATFRTFGCSACVAASSAATDLLAGQTPEQAGGISAEVVEAALDGLPADKRYCATLVARAVAAALAALPGAPA